MCTPRTYVPIGGPARRLQTEMPTEIPNGDPEQRPLCPVTMPREVSRSRRGATFQRKSRSGVEKTSPNIPFDSLYQTSRNPVKFFSVPGPSLEYNTFLNSYRCYQYMRRPRCKHNTCLFSSPHPPMKSGKSNLAPRKMPGHYAVCPMGIFAFYCQLSQIGTSFKVELESFPSTFPLLSECPLTVHRSICAIKIWSSWFSYDPRRVL